MFYKELEEKIIKEQEKGLNDDFYEKNANTFEFFVRNPDSKSVIYNKDQKIVKERDTELTNINFPSINESIPVFLLDESSCFFK